MNEPPGARARVALTGLTVAEYFRDQEGQDVLLFIDNIFRFTQAGSEVSALLGRIPSAVGYQPTLATDMGTMQERITTTKKGSITSVQVCFITDYGLCTVPFTYSFIYVNEVRRCAKIKSSLSPFFVNPVQLKVNSKCNSFILIYEKNYT